MVAAVIAIVAIVGIHAAVIWLWFWPARRWEALQRRMERSYLQRWFAGMRALPALLISCWLVVAIAALGGNVINRVGNVGIIVALSPFLLFVTALVFSWPLWIIPPGARDSEVIGEAHWASSHPLGAAAIIFGLIAAGTLLGILIHR